MHDSIQSNLSLMANKFSPKYHDLKIYEFIWWNISCLHSFTFCLLISLQETCVYAWHILASKPLHNGLSADNTKSSDFWYFKEILSFYTLVLSDISLQCMHLHFPVQNNFIKVALFTKARFRFWVSNFKEFLFCNLQRMWKCMSQNFGSFITDKIVSCCL